MQRHHKLVVTILYQYRSALGNEFTSFASPCSCGWTLRSGARVLYQSFQFEASHCLYAYLWTVHMMWRLVKSQTHLRSGGCLTEAAHAGGGAYGAGGSGAYGGLGGLSQAALARLQPGPYLPPALAAFANAPPIHPVRKLC